MSTKKEIPCTDNSQQWLKRARRVIPSATQTLAKGPTQYVEGVAPVFLERGEGPWVWDVDGNKFLDWNMGIGPIILGYQYSKVDDAIREQLDRGITFSLVNTLEVEVAELLTEIIPGAESVRFSKTGADVTSAAIRLARSFTGRDKVLCCGYHGWHDWYIGTTPRGYGVPRPVSDLTRPFSYNQIQSLKDQIQNDVAAIIMEPTLFEEPANGFLEEVRALCDKHGTLLIFDEMWTGFRLALGGAQEFFGVRADLATFSKAIANGMPLSALTGRADVMSKLENEVFFYTTFGGETLSLAAAKATINELRSESVCEKIQARGSRLRDRFNQIAFEMDMEMLRCVGYGCRTLISIESPQENPLIVKSYMQQEYIRRGILWSGQQAMSYSHSDAEVETFLQATQEVLLGLREELAKGTLEKAILGKPIQPIFRTTTGR